MERVATGMAEDTEIKPEIAYDQRLARWLARPLARTAITPNMVTLAGMIMGLGAGWLFMRGDPAYANWGGALFIVAAWVDHLDGELARATGKTSRFGYYFDNVAMMTTYVATFVGMGIGLASRGLGGFYVPLGIAAGLAVAVIFVMRVWAENRLGTDSVAMKPVAGFEIEDILYTVGPIAWFDVVDYFVIAAGIGAPLFLVWSAWVVRRAARATRPATR